MPILPSALSGSLLLQHIILSVQFSVAWVTARVRCTLLPLHVQQILSWIMYLSAVCGSGTGRCSSWNYLRSGHQCSRFPRYDYKTAGEDFLLAEKRFQTEPKACNGTDFKNRYSYCIAGRFHSGGIYRLSPSLRTSVD